MIDYVHLPAVRGLPTSAPKSADAPKARRRSNQPSCKDNGYPIIEAGEVLPVPDGTPAGWDSSYDGYRAALARGEPPLVREHAQVIAHYLDDDAWFWDHWGGPPMVAHSSDGFTTFNARTMRE
ncbi:hypothetical protein [Candidatus Palauibacter sp.]|uniref:hypothetical protein n=1 Tax=Candidatus Palauibacter sp. TaxID=3101350 RepID=UPI003B51FAB7